MKKRKSPALLGQTVWNRLSDELSLWHTSEDSLPESIEQFKNKCKKLTVEEATALRSYLHKEIFNLEHNFSELTSSHEEALEYKWKRFYKACLSALQITMSE